MNNFLISTKGKRLAPPKKQRHKKSVAFILVFVLLLSLAVPVIAYALQENTPKQEVVYINLNSDGSVKNITVVNIFDLSEDGQIIDYGDYTALRNMTSNDEIHFENETVRIDTTAGKLYYEGTLSRNTMPWLISIRYYMDGVEYKGEELAGRSGALKITMSVRQNPNCDSTFFQHYALQASFMLDTNLCENIVTDGATQANVGRNRQLTYTILPDQDTDITITADVTDFEMEPIAINGVTLTMDIDIDKMDSEELDEKITEITDAIEDLDDGAQELLDGAEELQDGASELRDGTADLKTGADDAVTGSKEIYDGAVSLQSGTADAFSGAGSLYNGLSTLAGKNDDIIIGAHTVFDQLTSTAEAQLNAALTAAGMETVTLTPETYSTVLTDLLDILSGGAYSAAETQAAASIREQVETAVNAQIESAIRGNAETMALIEVGILQQANLADENFATVQELAAAQVSQAWLAQNDNNTEELAAFLASDEGRAAIQAAYTSIIDAAVTAAVDTEMAKDETKAAIEAAIAEQLAGDAVKQQISEGVATALADNTQYQSIVALKASLDNYYTFYTGLVAYTQGVSNAAGGAAELKSGISELSNGVGELADGAKTLYDGLVVLQDGAITLLNGAIELYDGTVELHDGVIELKDGTFEFRDKTATLEDEVKDKIRNAIDDIFGGDYNVKSFVSEKNTIIESVQFVIKTPSIVVDNAAENVATSPESLTVWEKLLRLFGIK